MALPKLLRRADCKWEQNTEHVHRLRVSTRRADAALAAYRPLFATRRWKKTRRHVRRMRGAAREARICDVHLAMLEERLPAAIGDARVTLADAIRLTRADRVVAQAPITRLAARCPAERIERWSRRLIASADDPASVDLDRVAVEHVGSLTEAARSAAAADLGVPTNLHALRLAAKKLRYGLEIFGPCFDSPVRQTILPRLKEAGDRLGAINDVFEMADRLERYAKRDGRGLRELATVYRADQDARSAAFLAWWREDVAADLLGRIDALSLAPHLNG